MRRGKPRFRRRRYGLVGSASGTAGTAWWALLPAPQVRRAELLPVADSPARDREPAWQRLTGE